MASPVFAYRAGLVMLPDTLLAMKIKSFFRPLQKSLVIAFLIGSYAKVAIVQEIPAMTCNYN